MVLSLSHSSLERVRLGSMSRAARSPLVRRSPKAGRSHAVHGPVRRRVLVSSQSGGPLGTSAGFQPQQARKAVSEAVWNSIGPFHGAWTAPVGASGLRTKSPSLLIESTCFRRNIATADEHRPASSSVSAPRYPTPASHLCWTPFAAINTAAPGLRGRNQTSSCSS